MKRYLIYWSLFVITSVAQAQTLYITPLAEPPAPAKGQSFVLLASAATAAAGTSSGSTFVLHGTAGQPVVGRAASSTFALGQGLWQLVHPPNELALPAAPTLRAPEDGAADQPLTVQLVWDEVSGAGSYSVQIDLEEDFATPIEGEATGLPGTSVEVSGLAPGTTYFWRARAENAAGAGPYAPPFHFSTAVSTAAEDKAALPEHFALLPNYPNPFNPVTTLSFALPVSSEVRLIVFDAYGREVATLVQGRRPAGLHTVSFDAVRLASGLYFYRIEAGRFQATRQMLLIK